MLLCSGPGPTFFLKKSFPPPTPNLIYSGEIVLPAVRSLDRDFSPVKPTPNQRGREKTKPTSLRSEHKQQIQREILISPTSVSPPSDFSPPKKDTFGSKPTDTKGGGGS